jgi:hypothetical protein
MAGPPLYIQNCNYTVTTTAGTTTINQGTGVFYGAMFSQNGTSFLYTAYDIVISGTTTTTNQLTATTTAAGSGPTALPGPPGLAVRYKGNLVAVTSGTPGIVNTLWD